jgi:tetratricopeptide (TPR) repeat protein
MNVSRVKLVGVALVIFAVTVWLFWPSVHGEFLGGDDNEYLRQSERWNGLTWNAVKWAFTCTDSYYHPLARWSHVLDYQIWGKNAVGHHVTGLVVHALNAALVFGFLWTLLGATSLTTGERVTLAFWVAVVFAIHPLQVESAAWISGRTQLLCTTFGIACLWAYTGSARRWLVWTLYVAALLCKPMAVSFPFVMLAMDYYPLRRHEQLGWGRLLWDKAGMIALAAAASVATLIGKSQIGQVIPLATIPFSDRVYLAFESLTFYPLKLICPSHLSFFFPMRSGLSLHQWPVLASVLGVVVITAVAVMVTRRLPMLAAAWGAYVILVLPVSGLMPTAFQFVQQRYAYMSMLPLLLLAGAAGVWIWRRSPTVARVGLVGLVIGQLCALGIRTRDLIPDWRNQETVGRVALAESPDSEPLNRGFAMMLLDQGRATEALVYAQRAVEIAPEQSYSHMTLGSVLSRLGRQQEAMTQEEQAFRLDNNPATAHYNFGVALMRLGKTPEATEHFEQALRINPDFAEAHNDLGKVLAEMGKIADAIPHFEQALRINPDSVEAHFNLAVALESTGRTREALDHYQQALKLQPDFAPASNAVARLQAGQ